MTDRLYVNANDFPDTANKSLAWASSEIERLMGSSWQPMKTAPKNGTDILLWLGDPWNKCTLAHWFSPWGVWATDNDQTPGDEVSGIGDLVPTHWQPLPPPHEAVT